MLVPDDRFFQIAGLRLFRSRARLEAEILVLRHQLNVLWRRSPKRVALLQRQGSRFLIKENPADAGQGWTGDTPCLKDARFCIASI
jgi:hypothetical protein